MTEILLRQIERIQVILLNFEHEPKGRRKAQMPFDNQDLLLTSATHYFRVAPRLSSGRNVMFIRHIEIFVADPLKSKVFYEEVLGFETEVIQPNGVWMKLGQAELLLRRSNGEVNAKDFSKSQYNLVLCSDTPVKDLNQMKAKGLKVRGDDLGCPTFTDINGNWFQLIGPDGTFPKERL